MFISAPHPDHQKQCRLQSGKNYYAILRVTYGSSRPNPIRAGLNLADRGCASEAASPWGGVLARRRCVYLHRR